MITMVKQSQATLSHNGNVVSVVGPAVHVGALLVLASIWIDVARENELAEYLRRTRDRLMSIDTTCEVVV